MNQAGTFVTCGGHREACWWLYGSPRPALCCPQTSRGLHPILLQHGFHNT